MGEDITQVFKCLADETRLAILLLVQAEGELCVCEFTEVLDASQPKVSRHLAQLRRCGLVLDRRQGQWVHYRLHPDLPNWVRAVLASTAEGAATRLATWQAGLSAMGDRPERRRLCC